MKIHISMPIPDRHLATGVRLYRCPLEEMIRVSGRCQSRPCAPHLVRNVHCNLKPLGRVLPDPLQVPEHDVDDLGRGRDASAPVLGRY